MGRVPRLTDHAVERYQERLQRSTSIEKAKQDLIRLLPFGAYSDDPPAWLRHSREGVTGYWLIGDVCLILCSGRVAVTCIARGEIPPELRRARNNRRRARRYRASKVRAAKLPRKMRHQREDWVWA